MSQSSKFCSDFQMVTQGNKHCSIKHWFLPSYIALNPWALTAKSVVNHSASIDPELTIGDGSMKPDNLKKRRIHYNEVYYFNQT